MIKDFIEFKVHLINKKHVSLFHNTVLIFFCYKDGLVGMIYSNCYINDFLYGITKCLYCTV